MMARDQDAMDDLQERLGKRDVITLEPTWKGVLPLLLATYRDGTDDARRMALEELQRMAMAADRYNQEHAREASDGQA